MIKARGSGFSPMDEKGVDGICKYVVEIGQRNANSVTIHPIRQSS